MILLAMVRSVFSSALANQPISLIAMRFQNTLICTHRTKAFLADSGRGLSRTRLASLLHFKNKNLSLYAISQRSYLSSASSTNTNVTTKTSDLKITEDVNQNNTGPSIERLNNTKLIMEEEVKTFLVNRLEYRIYTKDVVLENYWNPEKPRISKGLLSYAFNAMKGRTYIHFRNPKVRTTIANSRTDPNDGTILIDWSLEILKQSSMFSVVNFSPSSMRKSARDLSNVIHGSSKFYVNKDGFVYKHVLNRVSPGSTVGDMKTSKPKDNQKTMKSN